MSGATYKKRTESSFLNACLDYLQMLENEKIILHCDRLNSGTIFIPGQRIGNKYIPPRKIRLCRPGTADAYFINKKGIFIFIETKKTTDQTPKQKQFQSMIESAGHKYWLIYSVDELMIRVKTIIDDK